MKKYLLLIVLNFAIISSFSNSQDIKIIFEKIDNSKIELNKEDIKKIDFRTLNQNYFVYFYTNNKGVKEYETNLIQELTFETNGITFNNDGNIKYINFADLDSILFLPNLSIPSEVNLYDKELVYRWIDEVIKLGQVSVGFSPPVAARGYGYTALALYETLLPGMPENVSMKGQIVDWQGLNTKPDANVKLHWGLVINAVMANMCLKIPAESNRQAWKDEVIALEAFYNNKYKAECTTAEYNASIAYGKACSDEVYAYSKTDPIYATIKTEPKEVHNSNFPVDYVPPTGPGKWRPTFPLSQGALQPYWGVTRPFLKKNVDLAPPPPNEFSMDTNSIYYKEMMEVYTTFKNLTPEQRIIGLYWDDAPFKTQTPGGHSIKIYNQLMKDNEFKISTSVESFLKVSMAVHDAFVNCWKYKYVFNTERPISYLRDSLNLQDFTPIIATPPFPDYCSGHSNQSGAAMTVFQNQFGANYTFTDSSHVNRSDIDAATRAARTYNKFSDMYNEVAMSRLYAGIHFRKSIEEGVKIGQQIGQNIWDLKYRK